MASELSWGRAGSISLYLTNQDLEPLTADATIWAQIYTSRPTRQQVLGQTGGILSAAITSFTLDATSGAIQLAIEAVDDPEPNADESDECYYLGIYYKSDPAEQAQAAIAALKFRRDVTFLDRLDITQSDLEGIDRNIQWLYGASSTSIAAISAQVEQEFIAFFRARGVDIHAIQNWGDLKWAGIYKALELAHIGEIEVDGDGHTKKAELYSEKAAQALDNFAADIRPVDNEQGDERDLDNSQSSIRVFG